MALTGKQAAAKLEKGIGNIKNVLFCLNVLSWILGVIVFAMCLWIRFDSEIQYWVNVLDISDFFWGVYILTLSSLLAILLAFLGCTSALMEHPTLLLGNTAAQLFVFLLGIIGAALLKDYSSYQSNIQPAIRRTMMRLISLYPQDSGASHVLRMVQENIGCCGADGPNDYIGLRRALPTECRDTITGNVYFHGCVDELTWLLDDRCSWTVGIAIVLCAMEVVNAVLSFSLLQAVQKQEEVISMYNR